MTFILQYSQLWAPEKKIFAFCQFNHSPLHGQRTPLCTAITHHRAVDRNVKLLVAM